MATAAAWHAPNRTASRPRRKRAARPEEPRIGVAPAGSLRSSLMAPRVRQASWEPRCAPAAAAPERPSRSFWVAGGRRLAARRGQPRILRGLAATHAAAVALAYLDPPFFTNREHAAWLRKAGEDRAPRARASTRSTTAGPTSRVPRRPRRAPRRRRASSLAPHGSVVVHVDPKTSHYVKRPRRRDLRRGRTSPARSSGATGAGPARRPTSSACTTCSSAGARTPRVDAAVEPALRAARRLDARDVGHATSNAPSSAGRAARALVVDAEEDGGRSDGRRLGDRRHRADRPRANRLSVAEARGAARAPRRRAVERAGTLVLDPYAGSGTTLAVAHRHGSRLHRHRREPGRLETTRARFEALGAPLVESPPAYAAPRTSRPKKSA